jgi:hypothetical protein
MLTALGGIHLFRVTQSLQRPFDAFKEGQPTLAHPPLQPNGWNVARWRGV